MPLNTVSGLWIIILCITCEFSCSDGTSYKNNKEKFINLAVSTDYVYIGGETSLIQLDSSLQLIEKKDMGYKNWLLTVYNNTMLFICNYKLNGNTECFPFKGDLNFFVPNGSTVALKIREPSAKYVTAKVDGKDILMIASSKCLSYNTENTKCKAISSYKLEDRPFDEFKHTSGQPPHSYEVHYVKSKSVNFIDSFKIDKFVYFLFTTLEGQSKLGKICTSNPSFRTNSYEDTPIICSHNGLNYTVAQDVVHWKEYGTKIWIFVAFSDISSTSSVICRYELTDVIARFMESRKQRLKCPYKELMNSYFSEQGIKNYCFNEEMGICQSESRNNSCPEITHDGDGFCNTTFFGSVEGSLPITSNDVIFTSTDQSSVTGTVVKLAVVPFYTHAIIYAGTSDGMIGQIFVTGNEKKVLDEFKKVQKSSPVLDIKVQNEDVYVMTQNMVVNVAEKIKPCPHNVSNCEDCMELRNPVCGWNIVSKRCEKNPGTATWWLPSLGGQCLKLKVEDIFKEDSTVGMKESINVTFSFDPAIAFYYLNCQYAKEQTKAYNLLTGSYRCLLEVTDVQFQLNVTHGSNSSGENILIASTTVQPMKCSTLNRCSKCLDNNRCFWCLSDSSCVSSTSSCPTNTRYLNHTMVENCPKISVAKVVIHKSDKDWPPENLTIPVKHFDTFVLDENKLKCVVIDEDEDDDDGDCEDSKDCDVYLASTWSPFTNVKCLNIKTPQSDKKLHIFLKYNERKVERSVKLEVYECTKFRDYGICMYRKSQGYQCKWCPKNKGNEQCARVADECAAGHGTSNTDKLKVDPNSGPENGGTTITISGFDFGYQGDLTTVVVNGVGCTEAMVTNPYVVECKTGSRSSSTSKDISVTISNVTVTASNLFTYKKPLQLLGFRPQKSIQAGGKKITIVGVNIGFSGSGYNISFCNVLRTTCVSCRYIKVRTVNANRTMCKMGKADNDDLKLTNLYVTIDDNTKLNFTAEIFQFVPNPKIIPILPESGKVFKSGGSKITIQGSGFEDVGEVRMENVDDPCSKETESIVCKTPPFVKSDFNRRKRATGQNVVIRLDDYSHVSTIYYVDDPTFSPWSNVIEYEEGEKGAPIVIEGANLLDGAKQEDYVVNIGLDGKCFIEEMTDWNITCFPPKNKPRTNHSDENIAFVIVQVARIQINLGYIKYITALPILPMVIGILGGLLVVAVVLGSAFVCVSRRKRKTAEKNFQMELVNMEDKIRETSREEFADAQMTIRDIKSDLVTSRVPYCNYQSYAFHQLFPNQDMDTHPILFEPMVTDDNRRKVQKAMDMFDKLMTNKLFMKSLVQTLESQNKLTPQDKAMFASLLSVCLIGNMKLFYQLINSLLIDMIKSATKKQQKVLFRRFESITQRLVVHWLALSLFDHLKKNGGMQLFMLYKATQTVIEKAPIDAVTILCKNTLAEERLLKNRVEHEVLTLDIDLNGNSDQRIPVIVLDCDTITQVKKKCCTAIYKNQPASEIPTPDELELEWHAGKSGKLTLQDIDNISDRSNGMIRLNTLKHYMVKNGSVMALMYKESSGPDDDIYENQHVQGMVPTSTDHVKLLMPETAADNQDLKWHLSNLPDEEKSNKEHEIGEIFLNRLFHTKLILRDYIEACFEGITDSQSLSIPVRYFLCMIDKQGKEVGVDGDILQSWKSECYATRVWASLIAKPQILFDVNVPSHVEPCMDILKQVFIDSFTQCPQHVTKDASTQKLLFCKDIPEYRKNVNSFFIKVEAVNDQEFWKAMDEISSEQTKEMKFSRQATLHQLYKFIAKYKDEIIEDFQEKDETKDLAFGNKLEEVIDLMEEP